MRFGALPASAQADMQNSNNLVSGVQEHERRLNFVNISLREYTDSGIRIRPREKWLVGHFRSLSSLVRHLYERLSNSLRPRGQIRGQRSSKGLRDNRKNLQKIFSQLRIFCVGSCRKSCTGAKRKMCSVARFFLRARRQHHRSPACANQVEIL